MKPTPASIGQKVRLCRKANEAHARACRNQGFPSGKYGVVRNRKVFRRHWSKWWNLSQLPDLKIVTDNILETEAFAEPTY